MRDIKEIQTMLVLELLESLDRIKLINKKLDYYNEILGDTSFLLAGLLQAHLKKNKRWNAKRWIDDSLITNIELKDERLCIWGIMIWGEEGTTEQWTDPFYFEIELALKEMTFKMYTLLFCDLDNSEISYDDFKYNRDYWNRLEIRWKYIIESEGRTIS